MAAEALNARALGRLDEAMTRHVDNGYIAGAVWAVHRKGETHVGAAGTFEMGGGPPMARDTNFRIASLTKPVTAAAAMALVDAGVLALDEPVDTLLPESREPRVLTRVDAALHDTVPAKRAITLHDLLTQRFGLGVIMTFPEKHPIQQAMRDAGIAPSAQPPTMSPDTYMERLGGLPLTYQPGEAFLYHTGLDVAGVLIARASGKSLGEVLDERIFTPLGMIDTGFFVPADKLDRLPTAYRSDSQSGALVVFDAAEGGSYSKPPPFESGAGGLVSTIDDYLTFCRMMLNGGALDGTRVLQPATVAEMTRDQLTAEQKRAPDALPFMNGHSGWGLGVAVVLERAKPWLTPGRFGWDGGTGTSAYTDPEEGLIGIFTCQRLLDSPEPEHALILEGQVALLLGAKRYEMKAGDYVCFPAGQTIGHSFMNSGPGPCSYLMTGERNPNDVCVMPDSNKMEVRALRTEKSIFDMSAVRDYLDGEQTSSRDAVMTHASGKTRADSASRVIMASPQAIYQAFLDPDAWVSWLPPKGMKGRIHMFEPRKGGAYRMALTYDDATHSTPGKSSGHTDIVDGRFMELVPNKRIVHVVQFESEDPAFAGAMRITWSLAAVPGGTSVTILCENVPEGIRKEDHDAGLKSTLENLAAYTE